jgi:hypothetical protein
MHGAVVRFLSMDEAEKRRLIASAELTILPLGDQLLMSVGPNSIHEISAYDDRRGQL